MSDTTYKNKIEAKSNLENAILEFIKASEADDDDQDQIAQGIADTAYDVSGKTINLNVE